MNPLPKRIIRLDDGMEFVLNDSDNLYYLQLSIDIPGDFGYTYERLMEDPRSKDKFKIADGTEDLEQMRKNWMKRMDSFNVSGCGEDDGC